MIRARATNFPPWIGEFLIIIFWLVLNFIFFGSIKSWCGRGRDLRRKRETGIFKDRRLWNVTFCCCCLFKKKSEWPTRGEQQFLLKIKGDFFSFYFSFEVSSVENSSGDKSASSFNAQLPLILKKFSDNINHIFLGQWTRKSVFLLDPFYYYTIYDWV